MVIFSKQKIFLSCGKFCISAIFYLSICSIFIYGYKANSNINILPKGCYQADEVSSVRVTNTSGDKTIKVLSAEIKVLESEYDSSSPLLQLMVAGKEDSFVGYGNYIEDLTNSPETHHFYGDCDGGKIEAQASVKGDKIFLVINSSYFRLSSSSPTSSCGESRYTSHFNNVVFKKIICEDEKR